MTTRREFTQGSMVALFMSFLAAFSAEETEAQVDEDPLTDVDVLTRYRDQLMGMVSNPSIVGSDSISDEFFISYAAWNLDHAIMRRCPHDPATYIRQPDINDDGLILEGCVICPECRAKTYALNAKGYPDAPWCDSA